jgi:hypothetical protein
VLARAAAAAAAHWIGLACGQNSDFWNTFVAKLALSRHYLQKLLGE